MSKFLEVYKITEDGRREWVASYEPKFSAFYVMQMFWCQLHEYSYLNRKKLLRAAEKIKVTERSAILEEDDAVYICIVPKGGAVYCGICSSTYEYTPFEAK